MPLKTGIQVNEADYKRFEKKIRQLKSLDSSVFPKILRRTGQSTVKEMSRYAPFDTGRLRTNIEYRSTKESVTWESEAIDPETNIDYAPIREFGLDGRGASHYFYPAIRGAFTDLLHRMDQAIKSVLRKK